MLDICGIQLVTEETTHGDISFLFFWCFLFLLLLNLSSWSSVSGGTSSSDTEAGNLCESCIDGFVEWLSLETSDDCINGLGIWCATEVGQELCNISGSYKVKIYSDLGFPRESAIKVEESPKGLNLYLNYPRK